MGLLYLSSVEEFDDAAGLGSLLLVVGHHDDSATILTVQFVEQFHNLCTHLRVEVTSGLVGQQNLWVANDGTGDGHTLALSARELCGDG